MRPNWFVACPVAAGDWFSACVAEPPPGVRVFHPDDLHLTLAFLGPVERGQAEAAFAAASEQPPAPCQISFARVAPLGSRRRPSALSALLEQGREALALYLSSHANRLLAAASLSVEREGREPLPHVTLARLDRRADRSERAHAIAWAESLSLAEARVTLDRVALYCSAQTGSERRFSITRSHGLEADRTGQ